MRQGQGGSAQGSHTPEPSLDVQFLTWKEAVGFVVIASVSIVVLFFFLNHIFALILVCMIEAAGL